LRRGGGDGVSMASAAPTQRARSAASNAPLAHLRHRASRTARAYRALRTVMFGDTHLGILRALLLSSRICCAHHRSRASA